MKFLGQAQLFSVASMLLHLHILNSRTNTGNRKKMDSSASVTVLMLSWSLKDRNGIWRGRVNREWELLKFFVGEELGICQLQPNTPLFKSPRFHTFISWWCANPSNDYAFLKSLRKGNDERKKSDSTFKLISMHNKMLPGCYRTGCKSLAIASTIIALRTKYNRHNDSSNI
jgi:hypothetical protein